MNSTGALPTGKAINLTVTIILAFSFLFAMNEESWKPETLYVLTATVNIWTFIFAPTISPTFYSIHEFYGVMKIVYPTVKAINPTMTIISAFSFLFAMSEETWKLVSLCRLAATINIWTFTFAPTISPTFYSIDELYGVRRIVLPTVKAIYPSVTIILAFSFLFAMNEETWKLMSLYVLTATENIWTFTFAPTISPTFYSIDELYGVMKIVVPSVKAIDPTMTIISAFSFLFAVNNETWKLVSLCVLAATVNIWTFTFTLPISPTFYSINELYGVMKIVLPTVKVINPNITIISAFSYWFAMNEETWKLVSLCVLAATVNIRTFTFAPIFHRRFIAFMNFTWF
jgi:hypothetical protein